MRDEEGVLAVMGCASEDGISCIFLRPRPLDMNPNEVFTHALGTGDVSMSINW